MKEGQAVGTCKEKSPEDKGLVLRGRLHVYKSMYDSPYDFMHDLQAGQIGI
jgi:hypothetical protein